MGAESLDNYLTFFRSPIHIQVFFLTIIYSSIVTVLCFAIAYPLAYYLSKVAKITAVPTLFLLLLIPLWVSEILRAFAWFIILALKGPLNYGLIGLGIIDQPVRWLSGFRSIIIGLVYTYVLFRSTTPSSRSTPTRSRRPRIWARPGGAPTGA
jgi:spermidine/putrescine transport system permease protein